MATLSTTASVLHELGLAAGFGGTLFGQLAMMPAVDQIQSKRERGKVNHVAWDRYSAVSGTSMALMAGTWIAGRTFLSGREVNRSSRVLTLTKDILVGTALVSGVAAMVFGKLLDRERAAENQPLTIDSRPRAETQKRVRFFERAVKTAGALYATLNGAVLATTAVLSMKAGKSPRWTLASRFLP